MPPPSNPDATPDTADLDPESLAAIRALIEDNVDSRGASEAGSEPQTMPPAHASATPAQPEAPPAAQDLCVQPESHAEKEHRGALRETLRRPPKWLTGAVMFVFVGWAFPWVLFATLFICALLTTAALLAFGYDGLWRRGIALGRWYARRRPSRTDGILRKIDRFVARFDALLDRFPEGTVDGLYLPDLDDPSAAEARHDAALNRRLAGLRDPQV